MPGPKFAIDIHADAADLLTQPFSFSNTGDNVIIAGQAGLLIRVWKLWFIIGTLSTFGAVDSISFKDANVVLGGPAPFPAGVGAIWDFDTKPWWTCAVGDSFIINQSGSALIGGAAYYTQGTS